MELAEVIAEIVLFAVLGFRSFRNEQVARKALARYQQAKRLYEKTNRRIAEHIRSNLHRR